LTTSYSLEGNSPLTGVSLTPAWGGGKFFPDEEKVPSREETKGKKKISKKKAPCREEGRFYYLAEVVRVS